MILSTLSGTFLPDNLRLNFTFDVLVEVHFHEFEDQREMPRLFLTKMICLVLKHFYEPNDIVVVLQPAQGLDFLEFIDLGYYGSTWSMDLKTCFMHLMATSYCVLRDCALMTSEKVPSPFLLISL